MSSLLLPFPRVQGEEEVEMCATELLYQGILPSLPQYMVSVACGFKRRVDLVGVRCFMVPLNSQIVHTPGFHTPKDSRHFRTRMFRSRA